MIRHAQQADILIANHSLIFSKASWIPPYSYSILDEAHNIEDAATKAFTENVGFQDIYLLIESLRSSEAKKGLYFELEKKYPSVAHLKIFKSVISEARFALQDFSQKIISFFKVEQKSVNANIITESFMKTKEDAKFTVIEKACFDLIGFLKKIIEVLFVLSSSPQLNFNEKLKASAFAEKIEEKVRILKHLSSSENQNKIKWMKFVKTIAMDKKESLSWSFFSAPLEVAKELADTILAHLKSAVLISATLKVADSFSFFSQRSGLELLEKERVFFKSINSPFDFQRHVILGIPKDFPLYNHAKNRQYLEALCDSIKKIALLIRGKNLALFSSKERMKKVYAKIKKSLEEEKILTLCQNLDGSRYFLIRQLKETKQDMLVLGSKSFQEGVDISGLSTVFIDKLPFPHRQDPVIYARRNHLLEQGRNPFKEYELPLAIIALRQSFGRLIRKKTDFGVIIIFDNRLLDKDYNQLFIKSLPQSRVLYLAGDEFYSSLKEKFESLKIKI
jgi:ATP-dependent DNA helicase DinG